eukprot:1559898-Amphidinium_carterae.1
MGTEDRRGGAIIIPALKQHVAAKLAEEASVLKEKRKAREAKAAAAGAAPSGAFGKNKAGKKEEPAGST